MKITGQTLPRAVFDLSPKPRLVRDGFTGSRRSLAPRVEAGPELPALGERSRALLNIVILGLPMTLPAGGNTHATNTGSLVRELCQRGHDVLLLESAQAGCCEKPARFNTSFGRVAHYTGLKQLKDRFARPIRQADVVIVGAHLHEASATGTWVTRVAHGLTAFYDLDTPQTMSRLARGDHEGLSAPLIPRYQLYLSSAGGGILDFIEERHGSPLARPLYFAVDPELFFPEERSREWHLGYAGAYREDRQTGLDELMLEVARNWNEGRFVVAGSQYPKSIRWPRNVARYNQLAPAKRRAFFNGQKFTLNVTHHDSTIPGFSPNSRLFEAAACGTPILSDYCEGLENIFEPHREILITSSFEESLYYLLETTEAERQQIARRARARVLSRHTTRHRALELERYVMDILKPGSDQSQS